MWLNGRALVFETKGCGFEPRHEYTFCPFIHVRDHKGRGESLVFLKIIFLFFIFLRIAGSDRNRRRETPTHDL
jgi:hypothetical protein